MNTEKAPVPTFKEWAVKHGTPWQVSFPTRGGVKGKRRFFATEAEALAQVTAWVKGRDHSVGLGKRVVDDVAHALTLLPPGITLIQAVRAGVEALSGRSRVPLKEVTEAYLSDLKVMKRSRPYQDEQERLVGLMLKELGGDTHFSALSKAVLLKFIKADTESYWNRYANKRLVSALITKARELEAIKLDPLDGWTFEDAPTRERPHYLSQGDVEVFLGFVQRERPELLPAFVFQLFAGIRTEELGREDTTKKRSLLWSDIRFGQEIDVDAKVSKTNSRRTIAYWPAALTNWLSPYAKSTGRVSPAGVDLSDVKSKLLKLLSKERQAAGLPALPFKQNDFRRTYATHLVRFLGGEKARECMGHEETSDMLDKHYNGYVEAPAAAAYFTSAPQCSSTQNSSPSTQTTTSSDSSSPTQAPQTTTALSTFPPASLGSPSMALAS